MSVWLNWAKSRVLAVDNCEFLQLLRQVAVACITAGVGRSWTQYVDSLMECRAHGSCGH